MPKRTCTIDGCDRPRIYREWCGMHYQRWKAAKKRVLPVRADLPGEEWRPVIGYEDDYQVSNQGRLWSRPRKGNNGGLMRQFPNRWGHLQVCMTKNGQHRTERGHILVSAAFIGPRPEGLAIRHLDGDPANNRVENLCYGTAKENSADMKRHGTCWQLNRTHCPQGHLYDEKNTYRFPKGWRSCRACKRKSARSARAQSV